MLNTSNYSLILSQSSSFMEKSDESVKHNTTAGTIPPYSAAAQKTILQTSQNLKTQQEYLKVPKRPPGSIPKYQGGWLSADQSWTTTKLAATLSNPTTLKPQQPPNTPQHPQHPSCQDLCTLSTVAKCEELCSAPVYKTLTRISAECKLTRAS